ncbi:hypothetical protein P0R31_30505 [Bradyrhizobium yuanmingense]|uniref:hypothetical protein n=1 Tax=Bradyrhizobium yuanmingense TaxID=108015 RepID=UPI0023B9FD11|nr:hypothetical protein [Bradyrhizobium yuanmingense]MDF0521581.1 hypothetical protein [Bradyrhizobium yuanmingense]
MNQTSAVTTSVASLNGQWIGIYSSKRNSDGLLVVELDDVGSQYEGSVYAIANDRTVPASYGELSIPKGQETVSVRVPLVLVERGTGNTITDDSIKKTHPDATIAKFADVNLAISEREIQIHWSTDTGTRGEGFLKRSEGGEESSLSSIERSWDEFNWSTTSALSVSRAGK